MNSKIKYFHLQYKSNKTMSDLLETTFEFWSLIAKTVATLNSPETIRYKFIQQ